MDIKSTSCISRGRWPKLSLIFLYSRISSRNFPFERGGTSLSSGNSQCLFLIGFFNWIEVSCLNYTERLWDSEWFISKCSVEGGQGSHTGPRLGEQSQGHQACRRGKNQTWVTEFHTETCLWNSTSIFSTSIVVNRFAFTNTRRKCGLL